MSAIHDVLATNEVVERFGVSRETVARAIERGQLIEGKDCRKVGYVWIIAEAAAHRVFDRYQWRADEGHIFCNKCNRHLPHTDMHFKPYTDRRGIERLTRTCRDCINAQQQAWRAQNRRRLRVYNRIKSRKWREEHPGYDARSQARYRQRKQQENAA